MLVIDKTLQNRKEDLLSYFRSRTQEILPELKKEYGNQGYKDICSELPKDLKKSRQEIVSTIEQTGKLEAWSKQDITYSILLVHHCMNVVMLDTRNEIWAYDYMSFSRRIGEVWEDFCHKCFVYPSEDSIIFEVPPVFNDVRLQLASEVNNYILKLPLEDAEKKQLRDYYEKVWYLVDAGEIRLDLDVHFKFKDEHFNIDFKSGFGSNEKGNTNRLLLVATIYKNMFAEKYRNLILVRTPEEGNNHYLQTLKKSSVWEVHCGDQAYKVIGDFCGINLTEWINKNIHWESDLSKATHQHFYKSDLIKYLEW